MAREAFLGENRSGFVGEGNRGKAFGFCGDRLSGFLALKFEQPEDTKKQDANEDRFPEQERRPASFSVPGRLCHALLLLLEFFFFKFWNGRKKVFSLQETIQRKIFEQ